jgi:phage terminase large subunit
MTQPAPGTPVDVKLLTAKARLYLARWKRDPVAYVMEAVGETPTHQQAALLRALVKHKFVAARSGHGVGKSRALAWLIHWYLDTHYLDGIPCRVPCTGAGSGGLADVLWSEVAGVLAKKAGWLRDQWVLNQDRLYSRELPKQWFAVLRVARRENPDALQGFHQCMYVIDEGSGVDDDVFEVAQGAMGDEGSLGVMTGNPTRLDGYFWKVFHKPSMWQRLHFPSTESLTDTEYVWKYTRPDGEVVDVKVRGRQTRAWSEAMKSEHGEASSAYRVRVLGEFGVTDYDSIIAGSDVAEVWKRNVCDRKKTGLRVMGVDPARYGEDTTGLVVAEGTRVLFAEEWGGSDTVVSAERARTRFLEWECDEVYIDANGVGAGVADNLRHMGVKAIGVMVSEKPPEDGDASCGILRDWLWWKLRTWFRRLPVQFGGTEQAEAWRKLGLELPQAGYRYGTKGQIQVESKEDMRKRGVPSPNLADALAMCMLRLAPRGHGVPKKGATEDDSRAAKKARARMAAKRRWLVV